MLSNMELADIIAIADPRERDAALDALSETDARAMLKSLVSIMRRTRDEAGKKKQ